METTASEAQPVATSAEAAVTTTTGNGKFIGTLQNVDCSTASRFSFVSEN